MGTFEHYVELLMERWLAANALAQEKGQVQASQTFDMSRWTLICNRRVLDKDGLEGLRIRAERSTRRNPQYIAALQREAHSIVTQDPYWGHLRLAQTLRLRGYVFSPPTITRIRRDVL